MLLSALPQTPTSVHLVASYKLRCALGKSTPPPHSLGPSDHKRGGEEFVCLIHGVTIVVGVTVAVGGAVVAGVS